MRCCQLDRDIHVGRKPWLAMLFTILVLLALTSCKSSASFDSSPVLIDARFGVQDPPPPFAWVRTDGNILVARTSADGFVRLVDKQTWMPLPLSVTFQGGKILVVNRKLDISSSYDLDAAIPSWCGEVFSPAEKVVAGGKVTVPELGIAFEVGLP
jgi:hypothetical protein